MKKTYRPKITFFLALLLSVLTLFAMYGCKSPQKKPETTPSPRQNAKANLSSEPQIKVFMHETKEIKNMKMEEYIAGVVAGEMQNDWPVAALAAQAIIARTFTVEAVESKGGVPARNADASTDVKEFQAYSAANINDNVKKAVEMTRGMIMTANGAPVKTWFHSSAGGMTAAAKEGLNYREAEPPYIQSVKSPDDSAPADIQNWAAVFEARDVLAALARQGVKADTLKSLAIGEKGPSGRAVTLVVNGRDKISGPDFRVALDSVKLKSMLLDKIEVSGQKVTFTGRGFGHGVGLSQWGARKLAQQGKKPEAIIAHYFKDVTVEKRWQ